MTAATPPSGDAEGPDDNRLVRRDGGEDTRSSDTANDQTRVVDRRPVGDTRVVSDDEATRLSNRTTDPAHETDPDRTQLSTRSPGEWRKRSRVRVSPAVPVTPPATPASATKAADGSGAAWTGVSRPPDAPVGSISSYGVRAAEPPPAAPLRRIEQSAAEPEVALPATAEQIRHADSAHARRRGLMAISLVVLATVLVAGLAIVAISVISSL